MQPLDYKMQRFLKQAYKRGLGNIHTYSTDKMRALFQPHVQLTNLDIRFKDHIARNGCTFREFSPNHVIDPTMPAVIYLPGNAYFMKRMNFNDVFCYYLANQLKAPVFAIYHRLAPEYPFPYFVYDALEVVMDIHKQYTRYGLQQDKFILWGESSGGNIGLSISHLLKDFYHPLFLHQVLFYPMTDLATPYPSKAQFANGYSMDATFVDWIIDKMLTKPQDRSNPVISPCLHQQFEGIPESTFILAGYDYFKDEAIAYADKLKHAGVTTTVKIYTSMIHGFLRFFPKHEVIQNAFHFACNQLCMRFSHQPLMTKII